MKSGFDALKKSYSQLKSDVKAAHLDGMLSLAKGLREFFREQITPEQAKEEIKKALGNREERFLELMLAKIYERPDSPYLKLLRLAGCEFSDLTSHVHSYGLERTLEQLAKEGVYLTSDEFKGKREVVRGGQSFEVSPEDFQCQNSPSGFVTQSSGTRNRPVKAFLSLDWLAARTATIGVFFEAHGLLHSAHAIYEPILPVGTGINNLLYNGKLGIPTERWFATQVPVASWLERNYHLLSTHAIIAMGRRLGASFPRPEFLHVNETHHIVDWMSAKRGQGTPCCVKTTASNAVRIARTAKQLGITLEGVKLICGGEPFTDFKRKILEESGASTTSRYAHGGGLNVGAGCANPTDTDDVHVNEHLLCLLPHPEPLAGTMPPIHPLLFTTLHPLAPRLLLNVQNGDYASLARKNCGCAMERAGLTLHLNRIRSYEKFTSEGMNYFYGDVFDFIERLLPSEFGGGPGDYQLVEEEDNMGQSRLTLFVDQKVGELNEGKLLSRLKERLSQGPKGNKFMTQLWQDTGTFRVLRKAPYASGRGKILPLHICRAETANTDS